MTNIGAKAQKKSARYSSVFALFVFVLGAAVAYWALTTLFPAELHEVGQWLRAKFAALRI